MSRETDRRTALVATLNAERAILVTKMGNDFLAGTPVETIESDAQRVADIDATITVLNALVIA